MKKNRIIQFSLLIAGLILFVFTYYSSDKDEIIKTDKNNIKDEGVQLTEETSNILENVNYIGNGVVELEVFCLVLAVTSSFPYTHEPL